VTFNQANTFGGDSVAELYCASQIHSVTSKMVDQMPGEMQKVDS
jgi:hypothetical protein